MILLVIVYLYVVYNFILYRSVKLIFVLIGLMWDVLK